MTESESSSAFPDSVAVTASLSGAGSTGQAAPHSILRLDHVSVAFGNKTAVRDITMDIPMNQVTALIGPSGSGKTTLLRSLNRMHDTVRGAKVTGSVKLGDLDIYAGRLSPTLLRSRVGMVFQRPNPFPTMSIYENAVAGLRFNGIRRRSLLDEAAESSLIAAALWDSVRARD